MMLRVCFVEKWVDRKIELAAYHVDGIQKIVLVMQRRRGPCPGV